MHLAPPTATCNDLAHVMMYVSARNNILKKLLFMYIYHGARPLGVLEFKTLGAFCLEKCTQY